MSDNITLEDFISETAQLVTVEMDNLIKSESLGSMRDAMSYATGGKGKRLRPALTRLVAKCMGFDEKSLIQMSATCEILHSASLMLDDIQDLDRMRRGKLSNHEMFSVATSSMGSGKLMFLALKVGRRRSVDIMDLLMDTILKLIEGQGMESGMRTYNQAKYLKMIELKTGVLYGAAAEVAAIYTKMNSVDRARVSRYGTQFGIAYQIVDDWTDILKSVLYEEPTGDLLTYKITLPLIYIFKKYPDTNGILTKYIDKVPGSETEVVNMIYGNEEYMSCIQDTLNYADDLKTEAIEEIMKVDWTDRELIEFFTEYPDYAINALKKEV